MLHSMFKNSIHINNLRAAGYGEADFPIEVKPVYMPISENEWSFSTANHYKELEGRVVSVRPDTGDVLGYHSKNYKITEHKPVIESIRSAVERASVNATNVREKITVAHRGARMIYQLELPEHVIKTPDGDTATLSFLGVNSFDGSFPLLLSVGAKQWACHNMQTFTDDALAVYKSRHTKGLDIEQGSRIISKGMEVLEKEAELWHYWAKQKVTDHRKVIANMLGIETDLDGTRTIVNTKSTMYNYILSKYCLHYAKSMGTNYWALYNAVTDWCTHAPSKGDKGNVFLMRKKKVSKMLNMFPKRVAA